MDKNQQAFFELLRAGLWEKEARFSQYKNIDFSAIMRMAEEQSVLGLVIAGIEHVSDVTVSKDAILQFVGSTLQIEQRNKSMNEFVAQLIKKLRKVDVYALLVKGQGIAQCYARPLWRTSGDVDLFLNKENYNKAKDVLLPMAEIEDEEDKSRLHQSMTLDGWSVELHGTLHGFIKRIDRVVDGVQDDIFHGGSVRSWMNGRTQVFLPAANEDIFLVFAHILQHFYLEGIGLRQICDWCRLLWTFRGKIDLRLLGSRIRKAGVLTEWKAFAAFAVEYLGMPVDAMPLYSNSGKWKKKARRILNMVMESGNFGHSRDMRYKQKYPFVVRYAMSFWLYTKLAIQRFSISPRNAIMAWWAIVKMGANAAAKAI